MDGLGGSCWRTEENEGGTVVGNVDECMGIRIQVGR